MTAETIRQVQDFLEIPVVVENVSSYAEFHVSRDDRVGVSQRSRRAADCGILLDVNNIYVSSQNHSFDPLTYVNSVPAERVAQIHIAGHSKFEKYILDTHDHPVIDPGVVALRARHRALRPDGDAAGVGRQHSLVRRGARRGAQGQPLSEARDRSERPAWRIE